MLIKLAILKNRLEYFEEEKDNILSDIEMVRVMSKKSPITHKRAKKLVKSIEKINLYKMKIEDAINTIGNEEDKNILYLRLVKGWTIEKISDKLNYSLSAIYYRLKKYGV